jgi:hypothetical protein
MGSQSVASVCCRRHQFLRQKDHSHPGVYGSLTKLSLCGSCCWDYGLLPPAGWSRVWSILASTLAIQLAMHPTSIDDLLLVPGKARCFCWLFVLATDGCKEEFICTLLVLLAVLPQVISWDMHPLLFDTSAGRRWILPPFRNIRCFSFVNLMYLDIF